MIRCAQCRAVVRRLDHAHQLVSPGGAYRVLCDSFCLRELLDAWERQIAEASAAFLRRGGR